MKQIVLLLVVWMGYSNLFSQTSSFDWIVKDDTVKIIPVADSIVYFDGDLINKTNKNLDVLIVKQSVSNPKNWANYICASSTCYPPTQDTIRPILGPNETMSLKFDVDVLNPANGDVATFKVTVLNNLNPSEVITHTFRINIQQTSKNKGLLNQFSVYPNPVTDVLKIRTTQLISTVEVLNLNGQSLMITHSPSIDVSNFSPGVYVVKIQGQNDYVEYHKFIKE
jgi:hypothetical protein